MKEQKELACPRIFGSWRLIGRSELAKEQVSATDRATSWRDQRIRIHSLGDGTDDTRRAPCFNPLPSPGVAEREEEEGEEEEGEGF